jgi:hypothetical protein
MYASPSIKIVRAARRSAPTGVSFSVSRAATARSKILQASVSDDARRSTRFRGSPPASSSWRPDDQRAFGCPAVELVETPALDLDRLDQRATRHARSAGLSISGIPAVWHDGKRERCGRRPGRLGPPPHLHERSTVANRLATATSPYLLQHADNPVDWREWSAEAFTEASERDVPVLLSVGYAACHWCHEVPRLAAVSGL